ncbi:hypothetical protein Acsp05_70170 [Actinokineospora sp. NBRC 105648]|nr:hypothetical protein Acsp05_70170 [Actinokineospora sp. NBRC 105648]
MTRFAVGLCVSLALSCLSAARPSPSPAPQPSALPALPTQPRPRSALLFCLCLHSLILKPYGTQHPLRMCSIWRTPFVWGRSAANLDLVVGMPFTPRFFPTAVL